MKRIWSHNAPQNAAQQLGYLPPDTDNSTIAWQHVQMRHLVARGRTDGGEGLWQVDTLFPDTLDGRIDSSGVDEGTADALYGFVRMLTPKVILETGTHKGRSTRAIAKALYENAEWQIVPYSYSCRIAPGHLYTVDLHDYGLMSSGALLPGTAEFVTQVVGRTPATLAAPPLDTLTGIDFAFLDGDHSPEGLDAELTYVDLHRAKECWVAIDNARDPGWTGVGRVAREWGLKYPRVSFASCTGLDVLWMNG